MKCPAFVRRTGRHSPKTGQGATLDIGLLLGSPPETVTVAADVPLIEAEKADRGLVVVRQNLAELPNDAVYQSARTVAYVRPSDAMQEFRVLANACDAQYGIFAGQRTTIYANYQSTWAGGTLAFDAGFTRRLTVNAGLAMGFLVSVTEKHGLLNRGFYANGVNPILLENRSDCISRFWRMAESALCIRTGRRAPYDMGWKMLQPRWPG